MIRTCPLMGCTYRRLEATLGSPKLRLLSLLSHFCPLSPLYSLCSLGSYPSTCSSSPACCCVPRPFLLLGGLVPHLYCPPLCLQGPQGVAPLSRNDPAVPVCLRLNNACNSRCIPAWDFYLGGDSYHPINLGTTRSS